MTRRAQLVCDSPDSLQDEAAYQNKVFSKNNYNTDFVRQNTHSSTDSKTQTNFNSGSVTTATIPYIRGTFETIARILQPYNIRVAQIRLPLEGWFTNLEQTPVNRSQRLPRHRTNGLLMKSSKTNYEGTTRELTI